MFDLVNVFETFLPQLLLYPNPSDPLNGEAAALHMRDPAAYARRVREHTARHATPDEVARLERGAGGAGGADEEEEEEGEGGEGGGFLSSSEDEDAAAGADM